jgi:cytochrome b involved in lipid metabolism
MFVRSALAELGLQSNAGGDATEDFEDVGHSTDARRRLDGLEVDKIAPAEQRVAPKRHSVRTGSHGGTHAVFMACVVTLAIASTWMYYHR